MNIPNPTYQNSAGRLLALCNAIPNDRAIIEALTKFLDPTAAAQGTTPDERMRLCMLWLNEMHELFEEFLADMQDAQITDDQRRVLLNGLKSFRLTIYPENLGAPYRRPSDAENSLLEMCAVSIRTEEPLASDDVVKIRESIAALRKIVETGDIAPQLRKILLELIRLSDDAIARYNIRGARGLRRAFKGMLAEAAEAYAMTTSVEKQDESHSGIWQTIRHHLSVVDAVAAKVLKYKPLIEAATTLLLPGH